MSKGADTSARESGIIGTLIELNGDPLPPTLAKLLANSPESFYDQRCGKTAVVIRKQRDAGQHPTPLSVLEELDFDGAPLFITNLKSYDVDLAEADAGPVWTAYQQRRVKSVCADAVNRMEADPSKAESIALHVRKSLDGLNAVADVPTGRELSALVRHDGNDPSELLRFRFLCLGAFLLLCGPTGIGKSSLAMQCMILWALGLPAFGMAPTKPIKSLLIQAENDDGDLAEMRDGVIAGLDLTPAQARRAMQNIIVLHEDKRMGARFFTEVVKPMLASVKPDLLCIDPALAYLGGENNSQEAVGGFLRNGLNPLLHEFDCAGLIVHHTNKPISGKEKNNWQAGDFAYLGAGSAEWANAARAVLALRSVGSHEVFELRAGKRGGRLGWQDSDGAKAFCKQIAHAKEPGVICWREIGADEVNPGGRPKTYDPEEMIALLPAGGLPAGEWQKLTKTECGIGEATFHRERRAFEKAGRIIRSKVSGKWQPVNTP